MKKIVLISKWAVGMTPVAMGEHSLNPFKKSKAQLFIDKLNEQLKNNNLDYTVVLDNESTSITKILNDNDVRLVLISPFIKGAILPTLTEEEKQQCYFLTENEYVNLEIDSLIKTNF